MSAHPHAAHGQPDEAPASHSHARSHAHQGHAHDHGVGDLSNRDNRRRLTLVLVLAATYSLVELGGGIYTSSLALLADAFHLLSDVSALGISLFAAWLSQRPATQQRTFGHSRAEILAALANGAGLVVMALMVSIRAVGRFEDPQSVNGLGVVLFATGALIYEGISLAILHRGREGNLNVHGAWLHILSDGLGSVGVIVSGALIWAYGWYWADPLASLVISALILFSAWSLIRDAVDILMEAAPSHLDVAQIRSAVAELEPVESIHDLHVWTIGGGDVSLSTHVVIGPEAGSDKLLSQVRQLLRDRFSISHTTIQIEQAGPGADLSSSEALCEGACDDGPEPDERSRPGS